MKKGHRVGAAYKERQD